MRQTMTIDTARGRRTEARARRSVRLSAIEVVALALVVLAVIAAAIAPALLRQTSGPHETSAIKVGQHDTLWEIAATHPIPGSTTAETVQVILDLNELSNSTIVAGQLLIVPSDITGGPVLASN